MFTRRLAYRLLLGSATVCLIGYTVPSTAQISSRPFLTADQCQPLTEENYELCCIAANRSRILTRAQIKQCPPITTSRIQALTDWPGSPSEGGFFRASAENGGSPSGGGSSGGSSSGGSSSGGGSSGGSSSGGSSSGGAGASAGAGAGASSGGTGAGAGASAGGGSSGGTGAGAGAGAGSGGAGAGAGASAGGASASAGGFGSP